jgi:hypothetical protein
MKKILLFHYFGGAGAKFIANCLSYSGKVAIQNFKIAHEILNEKNFTLLEQNLLNLIPEKHQGRTWLYLENGDTKLFGPDIELVRSGSSTCVSFDFLDQLGDVWLPIMTHDIKEFKNCLEYFSKNSAVTTVLVDSTTDFIDTSIRSKWPEDHHCLDIISYRVFRKNLENLNFDFVFDQWTPLEIDKRQEIVNLAKYLEISFDLTTAENFINKYLEFYK